MGSFTSSYVKPVAILTYKRLVWTGQITYHHTIVRDCDGLSRIHLGRKFDIHVFASPNLIIFKKKYAINYFAQFYFK